MRDEVIGLVHNEGHFGVDKTTLLTRARFFWRGMNKDIDFFCRKCSICARNKPKNAPPETLVPSIQASRPREAIAYDIATLPYANTNHRHFLLIVDTFSKFIELVPLFDQESHSIIQGLSDGWIYRHGPPVSVLSDQGPSVDGIEVREFLARLNITKKRSSAYHPEGDGQAERGIRSVKQIIRCLIAEHELQETDWSALLPRVSYILNALPSASTGFSPYKIMFGVDPRPISAAELEPAVQASYESVLEWVKELQETETLVNDQVNDNLAQARAKMKAEYDRGKRDTPSEAGDWVYLRNERRGNGLIPYYEGPYMVISRRGPNVKLRLHNGKEKVVHLNRCKRCPPPNSEWQLGMSDVEEQHAQSNPVIDSESLSETDPIGEQTEESIASGDLEPEPEPEPPEVRRSSRPRRAPKWLQEAWHEGVQDDS